MLLIYLRYEKFFIRNKCTINFTESVKALSINSLNGVKSYIYIPPRIIKINSIPGMVILNIFSFITVNYIAGDILTTTKRGTQMGKVIIDSFSCFNRGEILFDNKSHKQYSYKHEYQRNINRCSHCL